MRLGVLVSGSGSNLQALLDAEQRGELGDATIAVVISNRPSVKALERATKAGVAAVTIDHKGFKSRDEFDAALAETLAKHHVDAVVLAGFMRLLGRRFLSTYADRVLNIHPALLPAFPGVDAQKQAFDYGVKVTGVTVHFVDEGTDTGPIIAQVAVAVRDDDSAEKLRERLLAEEHKLYPMVVRAFAEGRIARVGRKVVIR